MAVLRSRRLERARGCFNHPPDQSAPKPSRTGTIFRIECNFESGAPNGTDPTAGGIFSRFLVDCAPTPPWNIYQHREREHIWNTLIGLPTTILRRHGGE